MTTPLGSNRISSGSQLSDRSQPSVLRSPVFWIIIAGLAAWGVYLAIGSTGAFVPDGGLFDTRKSAIVLVFSATFLVFWLWLVITVRKSTGTEDAHRLSRVSVASLGASLSGFLLWGMAYMVPDAISRNLGWIAGWLICLSLIPAIIGLSDPQPKRAKLAGLVTFMLFILAFVLLFAFPPDLS